MKLFTNPAWTITGILAASLSISATILPVITAQAPTVAATSAFGKTVDTQNAARVTKTPTTPTAGATTSTPAPSATPNPSPSVKATAAAVAKLATTAAKAGNTGNHRTGRAKYGSSPSSKTTSTPSPTSTPSTTASTTPNSSPSSTPSSSTPTSTPSANTGSSMPTGNQAGWTQTYAEDFTKTAALGQIASVYGKNMLGYNGFTDTSGNGTYSPNSVLTVHDSLLDYYIHYADGKYQTASPAPQGYTGQIYGKYSMRFRADTIPGYKVAFLLWPDSDKWTDGEIDFPEAELGGSINAYSHDVTGNPSHNALAWNTGITTNDWHTLTIEWTPDHLTYTIDGVSKTTTDKTAIPTKPMHLILQAETDLNGVKPATSAAGHIQIDWLTIYKYTP